MDATQAIIDGLAGLEPSARGNSEADAVDETQAIIDAMISPTVSSHTYEGHDEWYNDVDPRFNI
eukprot:15906613-Heterocapsa_arctica.AAC.1